MSFVGLKREKTEVEGSDLEMNSELSQSIGASVRMSEGALVFHSSMLSFEF